MTWIEAYIEDLERKKEEKFYDIIFSDGTFLAKDIRINNAIEITSKQKEKVKIIPHGEDNSNR